MIEQAWNYRSIVAKDINNSEGCGNASQGNGGVVK